MRATSRDAFTKSPLHDCLPPRVHVGRVGTERRGWRLGCHVPEARQDSVDLRSSAPEVLSLQHARKARQRCAHVSKNLFNISDMRRGIHLVMLMF